MDDMAQPLPDEFARKRRLLALMQETAVTVARQRRAIGANTLRASFGTFDGCGWVDIEAWQSGMIMVTLGPDREPTLRLAQKLIWDEAMFVDRMT